MGLTYTPMLNGTVALNNTAFEAAISFTSLPGNNIAAGSPLLSFK